MSDRDALTERTSALRALLAKAERKLPLDQPLRSGRLYAAAVEDLDALIDRLRATIEQALR